jgi:hypothetical protein
LRTVTDYFSYNGRYEEEKLNKNGNEGSPVIMGFQAEKNYHNTCMTEVDKDFIRNRIVICTFLKLHQINCLFAKNVMIPNKIVYKPRWEGVSFLSRAFVQLGYALVNYLSSRQELNTFHLGM